MEAWTYLKQSNKINNCEGTRTRDHLVCKEHSPSLAKWLSVCLLCKWLFVLVPLKSVSLEIVCLSSQVPLQLSNHKNVDSF